MICSTEGHQALAFSTKFRPKRKALQRNVTPLYFAAQTHKQKDPEKQRGEREMKKSGGAEKKRVRRSAGAVQNGARDPNSDTPPRVCSLSLSLSVI